MIKKKRYISPYIEFVEEEDDLLDGIGIGIGSGPEEDVDESKQAKEGYFIDDDDSHTFIFENDFEYEI